MNTRPTNPEETILAISRAALSVSNVVVHELQDDEELTLASLKEKHQLLAGQVGALKSIAKFDQAVAGDPTMDPEERISDALGHIEASIGAFIKYLVEKQSHVLKLLGVKARSSAVHRDGVVQELNKLIAAMSDLRDSLLDLRWAIMDHDADAETEVFGPYKTIADLRASWNDELTVEEEEAASLSLNWTAPFQ